MKLVKVVQLALPKWCRNCDGCIGSVGGIMLRALMNGEALASLHPFVLRMLLFLHIRCGNRGLSSSLNPCPGYC